MTALVWFRAWRALVVTLSAVTLAQLLELPQRLAYDARLWAQLTTPTHCTGTSLDQTVSFGLLLFGFAALVPAVLSERHPLQVGRVPGTGGIG